MGEDDFGSFCVSLAPPLYPSLLAHRRHAPASSSCKFSSLSSPSGREPLGLWVERPLPTRKCTCVGGLPDDSIEHSPLCQIPVVCLVTTIYPDDGSVYDVYSLATECSTAFLDTTHEYPVKGITPLRRT